MRRIGLALAFLLPGVLLADALSEAYQEAQRMTYVTPPEVVLYDAVSELKKDPTRYAPVAIAHTQLQSTAVDGIADVFDVMEMLYEAQRGDLETYQERFKTFRSRARNAKLLKVADISDLQERCNDCTNGFLVCKTCKGTLKCTECRGRGKVSRLTKSSGKKLGGDSMQVECPTCKGAKVCQECGGERTPCKTCKGTGKRLETEKIRNRIVSLATYTERKLAQMVESDLAAREQSAQLAKDVLHTRSLNTADALAYLEALPPERQSAAQWSQVEVLKGEMRKRLEALSTERIEAENATRNLRQVVATAQEQKNPLQGIDMLLPAMTTYAASDALPEAETALKGMVAAFRTQEQAAYTALDTRVRDLRMLQSPVERADSAQRILSSWPAEKDLSKYNGVTIGGEPLELVDKNQTKALEKLRNEVESIRRNAIAEQEQQVEEESQDLSGYWLYGGIGVGAVVLLYILGSLWHAMRERQKEAERKAREQAVRNSIRSTFSHRRDR